MTNSIGQLVLDLKENNEDFEFYPTTEEMLTAIYPYLDRDTVLDIGCGTCNFLKVMNKIYKRQYALYELKEKEYLSKGGYSSNLSRPSEPRKPITKYFVMEKSKILLQRLEDEAICIGTDFNENTLIDKKVNTIFCNPPYSEFENWTIKILSEGNYIQAFLVIPQRWKENTEIMKIIEHYDLSYDILGSYDFLNAERSARAKVDVIRFKKRRYKDVSSWCNDKSRHQQDFDIDAFNNYFNTTFNLDPEYQKLKDKENSSCMTEYHKEEEKKKQCYLSLSKAQEEGKSKAQVLTEMYQEEFTKLVKNLNCIMELDEDVIETFGLSVSKIKEALKMKITGLKAFYWERVMNEMDEITSRLTYGSRNSLMNDFRELKTIDYTMGNIYAFILWVNKNANKYYNSQLVDFFKKLSDEENVKPYKSNQKLFENDGYRWNSEKKRDYVLDYRIIMSSPFRTGWSGQFEKNEFEANRTLQDIRTIANNLGFETIDYHWKNLPDNFGEKVFIKNRGGEEVFLEYKCFKNGNMHCKFNKEFTKALNVEVSRLLGWIRCKEDIAREFPEELAKGAEKYFKTNYSCIGCNSLLLTTTKRDEE